MTVMGPGGAHPVTIRDKAAVAIAEIPVHLRQIGISLQQLATAATEHIYTLGPGTDGGWGVYCHQCSDQERAYVYPCKQATVEEMASEDHPPARLIPVMAPPST